MQSPYFEERKRVYDEMSTDYLIKGPAFISGGETSQSLKVERYREPFLSSVVGRYENRLEKFSLSEFSAK